MGCCCLCLAVCVKQLLVISSHGENVMTAAPHHTCPYRLSLCVSLTAWHRAILDN